MKILIIGSGGREHAIGLKLSQSPQKPTLLFAPGNPGMESLGTCLSVSAENPQALLELAQKEEIDFTVVGPEVPLVRGIVNIFEKKGLLAFGPSQLAARLEGSKAFSKDFMAKYAIPTARFQNFTELEPALSYLKEQGAPIVVKASGLAAGKGAIVCLTQSEAEEAVQSMLGKNAQFGSAGKEIVIEEFMEGEEASIFALSDGNDYVILPTSQDHKRIFDQDKGPNTGGMGAYAPAPLVTDKLLAEIEKKVVVPTLKGMQKEGCPYKGILYVGIMVTPTGPRVVEYNCRFGDPEAQVILPIMEADLLDLMVASVKGKLHSYQSPPCSENAAIVVLAAPGYPGSYPKGMIIQGLNEPLPKGCHVIHAGTQKNETDIMTAGGRVLGVVGQGASLKLALDTAYEGVKQVTFEKAFYRKDIGQKGLIRKGES